MTNLYDIVDEYKLEAMEELGRIAVKPSEDKDLYIYNYTNKAQFANEWTEEERVCRGMITNANGDIIARGMPKFFNDGDPRVGEIAPDEPFWLFEKFDGSLGVSYLDSNGMPRIATRGSFTSDQANMANHLLAKGEYDALRTMITEEARIGRTVLVEIIYPENKIVVDYGDEATLVWIGTVHNPTGRFWPNYNVAIVQTTMNAGVPVIPSNKEGYVAITDDGKMFKIKSEEYKALHKLTFGTSNKSVWEVWAHGGYTAIWQLKQTLPAALSVWIDREVRKLEIQQTKLYQQTLAAYRDVCGEEEHIERRWIGKRLQEKYPELLSFVFTFIDKDDKALIENIRKSLKPKSFKPYRTEPKED